MKPTTLLILIGSCVLAHPSIVPAVASAGVAACEARDPQIEVIMGGHEAVKIVLSTAEELTASGREQGLLRSKWSRVPGAYNAGITTSVQLDHKNEKDDQGVCATVVRAAITLSLSIRSIFIAREIAADACVRSLVERHEQKHAAYDETVLPQFFSDLERIAKSYFAGRPPLKAADEPMMRPLREQELRAFFDVVNGYVLSEIMPARVQLHQRHVDTPDEAAALREACGGRASTLLRW
jgi:hypothetical protein